MKIVSDIPYMEDALNEHCLDLYLPDAENFDTVIWFHGGGLETGSRKDAYMAQDFVNRKYGFVSADYRLYPSAKFPEYLEDAAAAVAFVIHNIKKYCGNGKVYITGQSAGAYITMMLCMDHHFLSDKGIDQNQISAYISDSSQQLCHYNVLREQGEDTRLERVDCHAPIFFVKESLDLRPLLLLYYEQDIVCRPEENKLMYANIRSILPKTMIEIDSLPGQHCSRSQAPGGEALISYKTCRFIESLK